MTQQPTLATLKEFLSGNVTVRILLASRSQAGVWAIRQVVIEDAVASTFLQLCRDSTEEAQKRDIRPYAPGYKADQHEIVRVDLAGELHLTDALASLKSDATEAQLFDENDDYLRHLRYYAVIVGDTSGRTATFIRSCHLKLELSKQGDCRKAVRKSLQSRNGNGLRLRSRIRLLRMG